MLPGSMQEDRDRNVVAIRTEGVCVVDRDTRITFWDRSLEWLLECPRERALGRTVADAISASRKTDLPGAMKETLTDRASRTISVRLAFATRDRVLSVQIFSSGTGCRWYGRTSRLAPVPTRSMPRRTSGWRSQAEAANDGLWEWNARSAEFSVTGRWYEMLGLAPRG